MQRITARSLGNALIQGIDGVVKASATSREALLGPYLFRDDEERDVVERDGKGNEVRRHAYQPLGPPVQLERGVHVLPDLSGLIRCVVEAGGRAEPVRRLQLAAQRLENLVCAYEQGLASACRPSRWVTVVQSHFDSVESAADRAMRWLRHWNQEVEPESGPDSSVLKDREIVFAETLVRMFRGEIKIDAARKMVSGGKLGPVVRIGKRKAVLKSSMYAHLLSQAEAA